MPHTYTGTKERQKAKPIVPITIKRTSLRRALRFMLGEAKGNLGMHTGGPHEQQYRADLEEAKLAVRYIKQELDIR